ncbi:prepilin peptidase [Streptomyces bohaiensis]|nr:A24 family peptidase [Streptomyces bohaiensis]
MSVPLIVAAAAYGAAVGSLVPRGVHRLSVEPDQPWRPRCPQGHPWPRGVRGWLGAARCCPACRGSSARRSSAPMPPAAAATEEQGPVDTASVSPDSGPLRDADSRGSHGVAADAHRGGDPGDHRSADGDGPASDHRAAVSGDGEAPAGDPPHRGAAPALPGTAAVEPPRRVLPAVVTAAVCGVLASAVGADPVLAVWLLLVPGMVAITAVDLAVLRLPDVLTYPMACLAAGGLGLCALLVADAGGSWLRALLGGITLSGSLLVLALINPRGMGLGDVKLSLALGTVLGWYGWGVLVLGVFAGFLLASVYAFHLVALRGAGRGTAFSMGPFLAAGTLVGVVLGGLAG